MALDNPSYFSVASSCESAQSASAASKRAPKMGNASSDSISTSSECSLRQCTPPLTAANKRIIRNLLRSVSSTSADSNQELLIMGQPRLSDIAPDLTFARALKEPRRANSLKHSRSDPRSDLLYSALPTSEAAAAELSGDEEVFLSEESARYYNFTAIQGSTANRRRHSIGTLMARERSVSVTSSNASFKDDFPQAIIHATPDGNTVRPVTSIVIDDHSMRHSSYPRKRCNRCTRGAVKRTTDMDDILIISVRNSEPAALWVEYFTGYFEISRQANRRPFKVHHLTLEDIIEANGDVRFISEKTASVKLQLIVLCPLFLDQIAKNLAQVSVLTKLIYPNRVLALLLGVSDDDIHDVHKNVLTTYSQWQRYGVGEDQDESFTKEFLASAMTIFTRVWKQQSSVSAQEKSHFSISPKKVRQGQNSVLILLTYPLQKEDIVKISIERNNEIVEVKAVKKRNPYTLKIAIPDSLTEVSAIVNILVAKNGSIIGSRPIKCESKLRELEQILRSTTNPVEFMCQTLGFSPHDKMQLDNWMIHTFQKNVPPQFNVLRADSTVFGKELKPCSEELPTLLHFAAKYGLEKLVMQLLDSPGGEAACEIRNVNDLVPADIAEFEGFSELAHMLRGYMKMNEFTKMYTTLKEISINPEKINEVDEYYLTPRDCNEFYKVCPPPKPVLTPTTPIEQPEYLAMNVPTKPKPLISLAPTPPEKPSTLMKSSTATSNSSISTLSPKETTPKNIPIVEDKQTELLEIINDFKNNIHSMDQAEKLVEEWKNRNDVQKSFKEKAEQLKELRMKYNKIQQDTKGASSNSVIFDRIKKFFSSSKSKETKTEKEINVVPVNTRPISSLSIQSTSSSGSSGRMSTISGCSLGDSGTHSDHEDRKNLINNTPDHLFGSTTQEVNYMVPPSPKPVQLGLFHNRNIFPPIEERAPHPVPRTIPEHYIQFPPSGLPVESLNNRHSEDNVYIEFNAKNDKVHTLSSTSPTTEYMNIPACGTSNSLDCPEYMNFSPPPTFPEKK